MTSFCSIRLLLKPMLLSFNRKNSRICFACYLVIVVAVIPIFILVSLLNVLLVKYIVVLDLDTF